MRISQLILYFQVVAAAGFTRTGEMERRITRAEKGAKDFLKEELVVSRTLNRTRARVVLEVVVVVIGVQEAVEGTPGEAVGITKRMPVEEEEVPLMMERISKTIAVTIQLVMAM